ncbi:MAG TPA: DUF2849 domain-containing protein [Rhizomicrobium sp.]
MAVTHPQMLTSNRLIDGEVLYWRDGSWVSGFDQGEVYDDPKAADAALAAAQGTVKDNKVVATYLFDVRRTAKGIEPVKEREIIRAAGPSVRADLGKQAGVGPQEPKNIEPTHV